ncbi:cytochrome P450 [Stachybotrys elegans]|uniref:Cytochrome P450 n=1 Tax=Stachybotrys elegans TaxID=80388 RepID=A0A8K0WSL4_9HYPO|nr:cytochrome P450 [Stachybotrys elegans]
MFSYDGNAVLWIVVPAALLSIYLAFATRSSPEDPPEVPAQLPIPYLGHTIGLLRNHIGYYPILSKRHRKPVFAVSHLAGKIYVVDKPEVALAILRNTKEVSFAELAASVVLRISLSSNEARKTVLKDVSGPGRKGSDNYTPDIFKNVHATLAPSTGLESMVSIACLYIAREAPLLGPLDGQPFKELDLWTTVRHFIVQATAEAVYGPMNPFRDQETEDGYWHFEESFTHLLTNVLPSITARKGHYGRERVRKAFEKYFAQGGHLKGSTLIKSRHDVAVRHGLSLIDMARLETTMAIGVLSNTPPSAFWMIFYIFSNPQLLHDLRKEMDPLVSTTTSGDKDPHRVIDVSRVRKSSLVSSIWNETLRHAGCGTSARIVETDCRVEVGEERYLFRKGNVIQLPSHTVQTNDRFWGENIKEFDGARFCGEQETGIRKAGVFRPFGGGATLCPGRHLSAAENTVMAVVVALSYEMEPVSGTWEEPEKWTPSMASAVYWPTKGVNVKVRRRQGFEKGTWEFTGMA